jgi:hypothetical protein
MGSWWPWLAIAGIGALHGLHPASGWMWAAAWGLRARDPAQALRALLPIVIGHAASLGLVAVAIAAGLSMDPERLLVMAGVLCVVAVMLHVGGRHAHRAPAGHAGLALWSFMMSSGHGAGLALVPTLLPLCAGPAQAAGASPSWLLALAAVGVHVGAMAIVTGLVAAGVCRGAQAGAKWLQRLRRLRLDGVCGRPPQDAPRRDAGRGPSGMSSQ